MTRESRLLLVTIAVAVIALLALARLRFPQPAPTVAEIPVAPLERLAARAPYDELAAAIARTEEAIEPSLIVLRVASNRVPLPLRLDDVLASRGADLRHVPALRIDGDTAVALMDPGMRIDGIVGPGAPQGTAAVIGTDPIRGLARIRVPPVEPRPPQSRALSDLDAPVYVVAVEGTRAGIIARPVFLGRGDRFGAPRWSRPLLPLGGGAAQPGALLFSLEGEFLGLAVDEGGTLAIAASADVLEAAGQIANQQRGGALDPGFAVQPLTPALAVAAGVGQGVIVTDVDEAGPSNGLLQPGDVITAVDGRAVDSAERLLLDLAGRAPGAMVVLTVVRGRGPTEVMLPLPAIEAEGSTPLPSGLREDDVILRLGGVVSPSRARVRRILAQAPPGSSLLAIVRRDGQQMAVAVQTPAQVDGQQR